MSGQRWEPEIHTLENGVQITVTQPEDPAYELLADPTVSSTPDLSIFREDCYICRDPEFQLMGLPLCYKCPLCGGHVAADDTECDNEQCEFEAQTYYQQQAEAECAAKGHIWKDHPEVILNTITWDPTKRFDEQVAEPMTYPAYTACERCRERKEP